MSIAVDSGPRRLDAIVAELTKLTAFFRRDFLVAWSYRMAFLSDAGNLVIQAFMFSFLGKLVDPSRLPSFNGTKASYMEFVAAGIALGAFVQLGLGRVATAIRQEQMVGTLEALLATPTRASTIQLGSVVYDLFYIPLRTAIFLGLVAFGFGLHFEADGILPALLILVLFIPFVWGLGVLSAAGILTFRRGSGVIGVGATLLTLGSGAYFPIQVLPGWLQGLARLNPITTAIDGMREALIGGSGWSGAGHELLILLPTSAVSLALGMKAFQLALGRERRRGTLGLY
jgi:ABC-2 type transport system permease protein